MPHQNGISGVGAGWHGGRVECKERQNSAKLSTPNMPCPCAARRVRGSHIGLGFNAVVLWIVAERLSQPEGQWKRFEPSGALGYAYRMLTHEAVPV